MLSKKEMSKQFLQKHALCCIYCHKNLEIQEDYLICQNKHTFDIKKNGSCFLLKNSNYKSSKFYTKELFENRRSFILNGYYTDINEYIYNFIKENLNSGNILDIGCGEGTHTHLITQCLSDNFKTYGIDYSKEAIDLATSYLNSNRIFLVGDVNNIPLSDDSMDIVIDYLSPFNTININRILKTNGYFIKVIPTTKYLHELRDLYSLNKYDEQEFKLNNNSFKIISEKILEKKFKVKNMNDKIYLSNMTPLTWNANNYDPNVITEITISLKVIILRKVV